MKCGFSLKHYAEIIFKAKKAKYAVLGTGEFAQRAKRAKRASRVLVLRHDVDFDPYRALEMARVERECGVRSTFFVRVHYDGYNPFGFRANAALREIEALGHEIGLHYECNDYAHAARDSRGARSARVSPAEALKREKTALEAALGHAIAGCAAHGDFTGISNKTFFRTFSRNRERELRNPKAFGFKYEAWEKPFRSLFYASDSLGKWNTGECVCSVVGEKERIYLTTHPVYWFKKFYHTG